MWSLKIFDRNSFFYRRPINYFYTFSILYIQKFQEVRDYFRIRSFFVFIYIISTGEAEAVQKLGRELSKASGR